MKGMSLTKYSLLKLEFFLESHCSNFIAKKGHACITQSFNFLKPTSPFLGICCFEARDTAESMYLLPSGTPDYTSQFIMREGKTTPLRLGKSKLACLKWGQAVTGDPLKISTAACK